MSIDDVIMELRFFVPSKKLADSILELNERYLNPGKKRRGYRILTGLLSHRKKITQHQRTIGERLYRHLAATARRLNNQEEDVNMWECIPQGMAVNLGFPTYREIDVQTELGRRTHDVLIDLTNEFRAWMLARPDGYQAPWGELWLNFSGDRLGMRTLSGHPRAVQPLLQPTEPVRSVGGLRLTGV